MSGPVSSTRARVLTVAVSSAAVALLGLGAVPTASAAPGGQISGTVTNAGGDTLADGYLRSVVVTKRSAKIAG